MMLPHYDWQRWYSEGSMEWFRRKRSEDNAQGRSAPTIPLESYAPILLRALDLTLDFVPIRVRLLGTPFFGEFFSGNFSEVGRSAFQLATQEGHAYLKTLQNAVVALLSIRPAEPELRLLHEVASYYTAVMLEYYDAMDSGFIASNVSRDRKAIQKLEREEKVGEQESKPLRDELRRQITALHAAHPGTYDRLGFAPRMLYILDLPELAQAAS